MKQQKKSNNGSGRKAKTNRAVTKTESAKKQRMKLIVGEPWTEPIENIEVKTESSRKDGVNVLFAWAFLVLLFALTAHAMAKGDQTTLEETLRIDKTGLACVALWAGGKAALRVLSGWHDSNRKGQ